MTEKLTITNERVDDIPLLLAQLERMQIASLLDQYFLSHGNWQGLSLGTVSSVWLTFILSEANHRLSHVQPWAEQRLNTLEGCLGQPVRALDWSDDRLAVVLDQLSDDLAWSKFEQALNGLMVRVYDLQPQRVRVDSTTAKGYVAVTAEGLFQLGHSKDHRPDLPQVKINLSALDPLGLPLTTTVVSGQRADDPLYVPEIKGVQRSLERSGITYIGDSKMAALATRAFIAASGDYYLCPLPEVQVTEADWAQLRAPVASGKLALTPIYRPTDPAAAKPEKLAEGYQHTVWVTASVDEQTLQWPERRLVVRSLKLAESQEQALRQRVGKALGAVAALNERRQGKKRWSEEAEVRGAAAEILAKYRVTELIQLSATTQGTDRTVRRYGNRPARVIQEGTAQVAGRVDATALAEAISRLGWRVYATNQPDTQLSLEEAVLAYRAEYLVERGFGRLKGKPLSLTPLYLDSDERVTGLIRLLMIGLRVLTLLEFSARGQLHREAGTLAGIYPGNPKRATARPTAELMLQAFAGLTLTVIDPAEGMHRHLTPFSAVQQRILQLLSLSPEIYLRVCQHFSKPVLNLSEP